MEVESLWSEWGWLLPQSVCAGSGCELAQPEGKRISLPVLIQHKAHSAVTGDLNVFLGDSFLSEHFLCLSQ